MSEGSSAAALRFRGGREAYEAATASISKSGGMERFAGPIKEKRDGAAGDGPLVLLLVIMVAVVLVESNDRSVVLLSDGPVVLLLVATMGVPALVPSNGLFVSYLTESFVNSNASRPCDHTKKKSARRGA